MSLATKLKQARKDSEKTGMELAKEADISVPYLSRLTHDEHIKPGVEIVYRLAKALGITMMELMDKDADAWYMTPMPQRTTSDKAHLFKAGSDNAVCGKDKQVPFLDMSMEPTDNPTNLCRECVYPTEEREAEYKRRCEIIETRVT